MRHFIAFGIAFLASFALAQAVPSDLPRGRGGPVASSNPTGGVATLDGLTVGFVDAGVVWASNNLCIHNVASTYYPSLMTSGASTVALRWTNDCVTAAADIFTANISTSVWNSPYAYQVAAGSVGTPSYSFTGDPNTGLYSVGADQLGISTGGARSFNFNATAGVVEGVDSTSKLTLNNASGASLNYGVNSITAGNGPITLAATTTITLTGTATNISTANSTFQLNGRIVAGNATPTISSGFGTSPSVTAGVNTMAFRVNVGTGGVATTGVIALGITATTGWNCFCSDITTTTATVDVCKQTASSTTTATIGNFTSGGIAGAWVASDILLVNCTAY